VNLKPLRASLPDLVADPELVLWRAHSKFRWSCFDKVRRMCKGFFTLCRWFCCGGIVPVGLHTTTWLSHDTADTVLSAEIEMM